jgi:hypothetical protein
MVESTTTTTTATTTTTSTNGSMINQPALKMPCLVHVVPEELKDLVVASSVKPNSVSLLILVPAIHHYPSSTIVDTETASSPTNAINTKQLPIDHELTSSMTNHRTESPTQSDTPGLAPVNMPSPDIPGITTVTTMPTPNSTALETNVMLFSTIDKNHLGMQYLNFISDHLQQFVDMTGYANLQKYIDFPWYQTLQRKMMMTKMKNLKKIYMDKGRSYKAVRKYF